MTDASDAVAESRGLQLKRENGAERLAYVIDIVGVRGSWQIHEPALSAVYGNSRSQSRLLLTCPPVAICCQRSLCEQSCDILGAVDSALGRPSRSSLRYRSSRRPVPHPTRRSLLKNTALTAGTMMLRRSAFSSSMSSSEGATRLDQFAYGDVELLPGPMLTQFDQNHRFFMNLNEDALLKPFREAAGLPAPGEDMGGWYSWSKDFDPPKNMTGYIPGHTFGQYLSGLARG